MEDEYTVREDPCMWCGEVLGRYSYQPVEGFWVHRNCDSDARRPQTLGRYFDLIKEHLSD